MIKSTQITAASTETEIFRSTSNGINGGTPQQMAVTCIIVCNTGTPDLTDESVNSATLSLNLSTTGTSTEVNRIVKNLIVPAGETIFFSDEKIILSANDQIRAEVGSGQANLLSITVSALAV